MNRPDPSRTNSATIPGHPSAQAKEPSFPNDEHPSATPLSNDSPTPAGRDSRGRFAPGNKGGPGNPYTRRCAALRQAMLDVVTPEDLQAIMRELIDRARQGDIAA